MAITYIKLAERPQKKGHIEVDTEFTDGVKTRMKTFSFPDQASIEANYTAVMEKAVLNCIDDQERNVNDEELVLKLKIHFQKNATLSKEQLTTFLDEKVPTKGALDG